MKECIVKTCGFEVSSKSSNTCVDHVGCCLECGGVRDRGPWTKYCEACYTKPCRRCGEPNTRGLGTVLCQICKDLPPIEDRSVCKRCGQKNDRGGRTTICSVCLKADSTQVKKAAAKVKNLESPKGMSWCSTCENYKVKDDFYAKNESTCRECRAKSSRTSSLEKQYGITEEQYSEIFAAQGNVCAICGNKPKKQRFHVDHDHKTGMVRGILCLWCNHKILGGARENIEILRKAVAYMELPPAVETVGKVFGQTGGRTKNRKYA